MSYQPLPITERILAIRSTYLKSPVAMEDDPYLNRTYRANSGDRWVSLGFLEGWLSNVGAPTLRRRLALAEAAELASYRPLINDCELLVGQPDFTELEPPQRRRYEELLGMFDMSSLPQRSRKCHIAPDLEKLLRVGVRGLLAEVTEKRDALNYNDRAAYSDFKVMEQYDFYECCRIELEAVVDLQKRYAARARELAEAATAPRAAELLRLAAILDRVPYEPAETFYEALQSLQLYVGTLFGLYPLGRPDRYLYPFYKRELEAGTLTRELAQELIDNFCLSISTRVFTRAACGFIVGGVDARGNTVENDLTYMFLTALEHIRLPDPNGALAVTDETGDELLRYAASILAKNTTHPALYNDKAIINGLLAYGVKPEDAVNYIHTTCAEISIIGKSRSITTPCYATLPRLLRTAAESCPAEADFDELCRRYVETIREDQRNQCFLYMVRMLDARRNANGPFRVDALVDNCLETGKTVWEGGAEYNFFQPVLIGFSTAVDSLSAIRQLVYQEKRLTLAEFVDITGQDYEGNEALRQYILNKVPHYGNDDKTVDALAGWLGEELRKIFREDPFPGGDHLMPGTFSYIIHDMEGSIDPASFDGRHAFCAYSDGCSPVQGRDTHGPTAMVRSLTSWDQSAFLGGMVLNMKFSPEHLVGEHTNVFLSVARTFFARGGVELQVNAVSRETLLDARAHPENHRNLMVRIGGFSDYFCRLTKTLQEEVIQRTEL